jgi:RNA polymerase sigma-70 factor, ECF subfamily
MVSSPMARSLAEEPAAPLATEANERKRALTERNFQFIWRSLRRLGLAPDQADDAAQQVFEVMARKLDQVALGSERAFLFKTALLVATEHRRLNARRRELTGDSDPDALPASQPDPETATGMLERRRLLDQVLDAMPLELRTVFVLFELEGMSASEIAELLEIPTGTASSRLRRSREEFHAQARRLRARLQFVGGKA